jgi:hypothetical protein
MLWVTIHLPTFSEERVMDLTALLLSRLQFAFTVSFHVIFPSFTIGLAAWLTTIEALHLVTGRPVYRIIFYQILKSLTLPRFPKTASETGPADIAFSPNRSASLC